MTDGWLEKLGPSRSIVARANTYQACLNIVARLPVALTLPRRLIQYLSIPPAVQICEVPLGFPTFTLDVIWSTPMEKNPDIRTMRTPFKDLASANALEPGELPRA